MMRLTLGSILIVLAFSFSAGPVFAASSSCDSALLSSDQLYSYTRILAYHMRKLNEDQVNRIVDLILKSNDFVNPLENATDTTSRQISKGLEQIRKATTAQDWVNIQTEVRSLIEQNRIESEDRNMRAEETSYVFSPQLLDTVGLTLENFALQSWQVVGDRVFVATSTTQQFPDANHFYVFELVNGKLQKIFHDNVFGAAVSAPAWQRTDKGVQIVLGTNGSYFYTYSFVNGQFKRMDCFKSIGKVGSTSIVLSSVAKVSSTNRSSERIFFTAYTYSKNDLYLFELIGKEAKYIGHLASAFSISNLSLQVVEGRVFLSIVSNARTFSIYEIIDGRIEGLASLPMDYPVASASLFINKGRLLAAVGGIKGHLYLYEIVDKKLNKLDAIKLQQGIESSPSWQEMAGRVLLAVSGNFKSAEIFEIKDDKFESLGEIEAPHPIKDSSAWQITDDGAYLSVGSANSSQLFLYKIITKFKKR